MGSPALTAPAKGTHVLFMVRNPGGITPVLSYLNSRSIKSWTATTLDDAEYKIRDNQINIVFLSISLKNVSIASIIEQLTTQFSVPIVIFSEEVSRKIEGDMSRLATTNKIVPPNHNAKFLQMIQKNVNLKGDGESEGGAEVEDLLPSNSEPIEGVVVPEQGRWLKINSDENAKPPFTFKLIQPRSMVIGRTRYFFVGPKIPELSPEGRGWVASEGKFYVSGRIVEMSAEPMSASSAPKAYEFSQEEAVKPVPAAKSTAEERAEDLPIAKIIHMPEKKIRSPSFMQRLFGRLRFRPGQLSAPSSLKAPAYSSLMKRLFGRLKYRPMSTEAAMNTPSPMITQASTPVVKRIFNRLRFKPIKRSLAKLRDIASLDPTDVIEMFQQIRPWISREPVNEIERALVKAAVRTMDPPFKDEVPPNTAPVDRVCVAFIRSAELEGFILSDATEGVGEQFDALVKLIATLRDRLNRKLNGVELLLPPTAVNVDPISLRDLATQGAHFTMWADNGSQRLFVAFIPAPGEELPRASTDHDKLEVQASSIQADLKLMFDLYLHMPRNDKHLQFRRSGQFVSDSMIKKLRDSTDTEVLIDSESEVAFIAYAALAALKKPRS